MTEMLKPKEVIKMMTRVIMVMKMMVLELVHLLLEGLTTSIEQAHAKYEMELVIENYE